MTVDFERLESGTMHGVYINKVAGRRVPRVLIYRNPSVDKEAAVYCALKDGLLAAVTRAILTNSK